MDNDFSVDLRELTETLASTDVVTMRFVAAGHRLLLDFRFTELDGPLVRVVTPVRSVRERYESLRQMRPRFPLPERIVSVLWPRYVDSLAASGAWRAVLQRCGESGHPSAVRGAEDALQQLRAFETAHQREAITGEGFRTLWSASARQR